MKHNSPSGVAVVSISREYRQDETVVFDR